MFFSGNFFPLATLSSIFDHIFSSLLRSLSLWLISEVRDLLARCFKSIVEIELIAMVRLRFLDSALSGKYGCKNTNVQI